ncbi:type II secretion system protein GspD [Pelomonas aquatica]|jgi:general secretion pathway protein D|uniref:Type II secretion system protein GspD n=2 Tax=Pelomonas aquatica TaxID=431058 RepID=A0A9X4LGJ2_9BURK|nr:type II secretion system protein GspD [Pelomonas aquatica]
MIMNLPRTAVVAAISALLLATSATQAQPDSATVQRGRAKGPAVKASSPVTLNFVNADIEAVTRAIGVMLDRQIIIDPRVKGTITVYSEQPVSVAEAYRNYLAALRGLGFTVVETAGLLKVLPEPDAKLQAGSVAVETSSVRGDQILTQIFRIQHENANNLVAVLRPLISPNNTINANPGNNSLVITDYADNLQRIAKIIAAMDTPGTSDIEIVPLKHAVAADLAPLVQRLADGGGTAAAAVPGQSSSAVSVLVDPRSNGLILRASNPARLAAVRSMVDKLDQPSSDGGNNIRVVYLKNADAAKLAVVLRAAFGAAASGGSGSTGGTSGSSFSGTGNNALAGNSQSLTGATGNTGSQGGMNATAATSPLSQSAGPTTGGFVQADPATNALIITAPEPLYRQVRAVIEQLDARRAQVYVESMIVKIDNSKAGQFGVQWQNLIGTKGDQVVGVSGTNFGTGLSNIFNVIAAGSGNRSTIGTALGTSSLPTGFNLGLVGKISGTYSIGALANFFESQSGANVLSTPNLVALDNEEARIVIGQNVPFVTGSYASTGATTGGTVNPFTTVDRKDVGLTLKIKSQIGEGGTVRMVVYQENSSVVPGSSGTQGPTLDKSAIETSVVVDDGDIIVLGGLLKDEYTDGDDGVPGLSRIPLLGNLFSSKNRKRVKTNLMVFLRPVVLRTAEGTSQLSLDRYESIRAAQQNGQPSKTYLLPDTGAPVLPEPKASAPKQ